jgi:hypothetical protein
MQSAIQSFDDRTDFYTIFFGNYVSFRYSLREALVHVHKASVNGNYPTAIVAAGQHVHFDLSAIVNGWERLGLPTPRLGKSIGRLDRKSIRLCAPQCAIVYWTTFGQIRSVIY